jgi:hypothetical protein
MAAIGERIKDKLLQLKMTDGQRTLVEQRKIESHKAKHLDPSDAEEREWAKELKYAHQVYKDEVKILTEAKAVYAASQSILAKGKQADYKTRRGHCLRAVRHAREWCEAARVYVFVFTFATHHAMA